MKCKLYIAFAILLAAAQPAAAAADTVLIPRSCCEGKAFTLKIPVRVPAGASGEYEWYRNDTAIGAWGIIGAWGVLTPGTTAVVYTLPAESAYGHGKPLVLHFRYRLRDDCDDCEEWAESKRYVLSFSPVPAQPSAIAGSEGVCADASGLTYSVESVQGVSYSWSVPDGWAVTAGQGSSSVTVAAGASASSGNISVTPSNECGSGEVSPPLAVTVNSAAMIAGNTVVCMNEPELTYSATGIAGASYAWAVPSGWEITAGQGSSSVMVTAGTVGGEISVTPSGSSCTGTLSVSINDVCICTTVAPGSTSVALCEGVTVVGSASVSACSGVNTVGSVGVSACSGVSSVGAISVATVEE